MLLVWLMNLPKGYQFAIALVFAAIALAIPLTLLVAFAAAFVAQNDELQDLRVRAGKLSAMAALKGDALKTLQLPAEGPNNTLLISAESLPIAKAQLQTRINAIVAAHGGSISSSGDVPDVAEKGLLLIGLRADISGTNDAIEAVLSEIESSRPPLMVREFILRSEGVPPVDRALVLTASLKLYGAIKPFEKLGSEESPSETGPSDGDPDL
jgi:hypothetical protein